jgi:DNA invertase Pin-like site-specific DNA recombinase
MLQMSSAKLKHEIRLRPRFNRRPDPCDATRGRGAKFHSLTEAIDTATPAGSAVSQMTRVLAELERSLMSERTRAGVKVAQRRGVKFGQKVKLTQEQIDNARKLIDKG